MSIRQLAPTMAAFSGRGPRLAVLLGASVLCAAAVAWNGGHGLGIMAAIGVASLASSIAGFAFSAICGAMLFHLSDDTVRIVQIMITCSIANQAAMTWAMRNEIAWRALRVYLAGGAMGLAIGVWALLHTDRTTYTHIIGAFLVIYGGYMLTRRPLIIRRQPAAVDVATGFMGGITGGLVGFPGAPVTIWCGMKGWDKSRQRAVVQPFILIMQIAALPAISLARGSGAASAYDPANLLFIPVSLIGTALGMALYRRLSDLQFARAVNVLLIVSGASYVV
jgi:uncharacterized membrane protein YfcA